MQIAKCPVAANVAAGYSIGLRGVQPLAEALPVLPASSILEANISIEHMIQQGSN